MNTTFICHISIEIGGDVLYIRLQNTVVAAAQPEAAIPRSRGLPLRVPLSSSEFALTDRGDLERVGKAPFGCASATAVNVVAKYCVRRLYA